MDLLTLFSHKKDVFLCQLMPATAIAHMEASCFCVVCPSLHLSTVYGWSNTELLTLILGAHLEFVAIV